MAENKVQDSVQLTKEDNNTLVKYVTKNYTLRPKTEDLWGYFYNTTATAQVDIQLPTAIVGDGFRFAVKTAQVFKIAPYGLETIENPNTGNQGSFGWKLVSSTLGSYVNLVCGTTGQWDIDLLIGTWYMTGSVVNDSPLWLGQLGMGVV